MSHHHQLGPRLSRGRGEAGHTVSILVPSAGPAMQAGKDLESFFSLSELPFQSDMHEAKQQGPQQGVLVV